MKIKKEKKCPCGRIITDPKNKTGLLVGIKKFGSKIIVGVKNILKK